MTVISVSRPPDGPSSCMGFLPLSWIYTYTKEEGDTPSTSCGDNTRSADGVGETPSTPGGDNTCRVAANKALVASLVCHKQWSTDMLDLRDVWLM